MKETEILLRSVMVHLLTAENLDDAIAKISIMLDEDQLIGVEKKVEQIKSKNKKKDA